MYIRMRLLLMMLAALFSSSDMPIQDGDVRTGDLISSDVSDSYHRSPISLTKPMYAIDIEKRLNRVIKPERDDSSWRRLSVAEWLLPMMLQREHVETREYEYTGGEHDLSILAGRAAWMIERLIGCDLPPITTDGGADALTRAHTIASAYAAGYRQGLLRHELDTFDRADKERALRKQYSTPINQYTQMHVFLKQWMPIGKPIRLLEEIMGEEEHVTDGVRMYVYGSFTAYAFYFVIEDGIIERVYYEVD